VGESWCRRHRTRLCQYSFGWRGLELLEKGLSPERVRDTLLATDTDPRGGNSAL